MASQDTKNNLSKENTALKRQIEDYERLFGISRLICSSVHVDEVLQQIIDEAIALCQADHGAIVLFDRAGFRGGKTLIRGKDHSGGTLDRHLNVLLSG